MHGTRLHTAEFFKEDKLCLATGCLWIPRHASTNSQKIRH
ncbi:hypothetical protein CG706_00210 [Escherichia coli]|nr:hypothetical protein CG706_00210 [Escherichia coli]